MLVRILPLLLLAAGLSGESRQPPRDPDVGTLASGRLGIPEPMVYDLVRPLGSPKGEVEINSLFLRPLRAGQKLQWAPEVEYTFAKGYGVELEFPAEGGSLESFKAAAQGKIGALSTKHTVWGWQALGERWRHDEQWKVDMLLLNGVRWSSRWSTFTMLGPRREQASGRAANAVLWNQSVFHHAGSDLFFGLESNLASRGAGSRAWLVMPQATWRKSRYNIQAGAGMRHAERRRKLVLGWRISREF
jgi:hypothetical protein